MAVNDLDYVQVVGRFAAAVGDQTDADAYPDVIWCNAGTVSIEPLVELARVAGFTGGPVTVGAQVITASINAQGWLTWNGQPSVWVVDLTSAKVNPKIGASGATHRVRFTDVTATLENGTTVVVKIPDATVRIAGPGPVDLTLAMPLNPGAQILLTTGPTGPTGPTGAPGPAGTPGTGSVNLPELARNLVPNPVLAAPTSWLAEANTAIAVAPGLGRNGRNALRVTHSSAGGGVSARVDCPTVVGQVYTYSVWVKRITGTNGISVGLSGTGTLYANAATLSASPDGVLLTGSFTATGTTTYLYHYNADPTNGIGAPPGTGSEFLLSEPILVAGPTRMDFFTGDDPGCRWAGTAYQSPSVKALYDGDDVVRTEKTPELARNLVQNPGPYQPSLGDPWTVGDSSTFAYGSSGSDPHIEYTAAAGDGTQRALMRTGPLTTGETYTATVEVWTNKAGATIFPEWVTDGYTPGVPVGYVSGPVSLPLVANQWTEVSFTKTITNGQPNPAVGNALQWLTSGLGAAPSTVRFRRARLVVGRRVGEFFDGDTPGARWVGTPRVSPSVKAMPRRHETLVDAPELARMKIVNPGVRGGSLSGWGDGFNGSVVAELNNGSHTGWVAAHNIGGGDSQSWIINSTQVPVTGGERVRLAVDMQLVTGAAAAVTNGASARMVIASYNAAGQYVGDQFNDWQPIRSALTTFTIDVTVDPNAAFYVVSFRTLGAYTPGAKAHWMNLRPGGATAGFDGDTPGCRWVGKRLESVSVKMLHGPEDDALLTWLDAGRARGVGSPEGRVSAPVGTRYVDTRGAVVDGGTGAVEWTKMSGTGATGWKVTAGSTGWRNIASSLVSGIVVEDHFRIRRDESICTLSLSGVKAGPQLVPIAPLSSGFIPAARALAILRDDYFTGKLGVWYVDPGGPLFVNSTDYLAFPDGARFGGTITWRTDDPWPTTLPGTAA